MNGQDSLLDALPIPASLIAFNDDKFLAVNTTWCELCSISRDSVILMRPSELLEQLPTNQSGNSYRTRLRLTEGRTLPIEAGWRRTSQSGPSILIWARQYDANVSRERNRLWKQVEASPECVLIFDLLTGTCIHSNLAAQEMFGLPKGELEGRPAARLIPNAQFEALCAQLEQLPISPACQRLSVTRGSGGTAAVDVRCCKARDAGRWIVVLNAREISKTTSINLEMARLRAVVDQISETAVLADPERMAYLDASERTSKLVGYSRQQVIAMGPGQIGPSDRSTNREVTRIEYLEAIREYPSTIIKERTTFTALANAVDTAEPPGYKKFHLQMARRAIRGKNSWLVVVVGRDLLGRQNTELELERRRAELAQTNLELERLAYVLSHDLAEPLRMVSSYARLIERRYSPLLDATANEAIGKITRGTEQLNALLNDLLVYSRAGRNAGPSRLIDMGAMVREVTSHLETSIRESGALVEYEELPIVFAPANSMMQLLHHLIGNAIKFHGTRPPIVRIQALKEANGWRFSVSDNGIGIDAADFDRVFLVFERILTPTQYTGSGIGLSICKKILLAVGGRIWIESSPNQGSTFHFTIPQQASADECR